MSSLPNTTTTNTTTPTPTDDNSFFESIIEKLQIANNLTEDEAFEEYLLASDREAKQALYREEAKLESEVIKLICDGKGDTLKPNSGEAVSIGENSICVGSHDDEEGEYRVWEWHGHIMAYNDENGFAPEYIYGNYFQRLTRNNVHAASIDIEGYQGLKNLIDDAAAAAAGNPARIIHRNLNAGSASLRF